MTSKKTAASKRTPVPRSADYARSLLKDWERLDQPLTGEWDGHRECHIGGDFLLAYKLDDSPK